MQVQALLRHPRQGLEGSGQKNGYGMIYGHFKKHASHPGNDHPSMPGPDHPDNHEQPPKLPVGQPEGKPPVPVIHPQPPTSLHPGPSGTHPAPASTHPAPASTHPSAHPAPPHGHPVQKKLVVSKMGPFDPIPPPAENALSTTQLVHSKLQKAFPPAVANFDKLFEAWKATWHTPEMEHEAKYELA